MFACKQPSQQDQHAAYRGLLEGIIMVHRMFTKAVFAREMSQHVAISE